MRRAEPCYLYINTAIFNGRQIIKIGISRDPDKRLHGINRAIYFRSHYYKVPQAVFCRAFTVKFKNRLLARRSETRFKRRHKKHLISEFGTEIFDINIDNAVLGLK